MKRFLWLGFVLFLYLICSGCGDTFRPIIIPNPPTFPNPAAAHTAVAITYNANSDGAAVSGSAMVVDVSGDADVSVTDVGLVPVHAVQQSANGVLVVNQATTGLNVPTTSCQVSVPPTPPNQVFNVCSSLTRLNFSGTVISSTSEISLPIYSGASFVAVAPNDTTAYVTMPTYPPDPTVPQNIVPSVGVVSTLTSNLVATIPVGNDPVALAVTPDHSKLYVANEGDSTVSGFNTLDRSPRVGSPASSSSPPIELIPRTDNQRVYVLEKNSTLAWLDTTSTAGPDAFTETAISVPTAVKMVYDSNANRLYIAGESVIGGVLQSAVVIADVSQSAPSLIAAVPIGVVQPSSRGAQDPCSVTAAMPLNNVDAAVLPDGSRAYIGSYYEDVADNICPQVTVIDAKSNTRKSTISIPGFPAYDGFCSPTLSPNPPRFRIMMAAAGDSTRAYFSSCDGGNVNIIDTSTDTYLLNLVAPTSSRPPIPPSQENPPQNPVFMFAGP